MSWLYLFLPTIGLGVAMVGSIEIGRRVGRWMRQHDPVEARAGVGVIEAAIFALLGLLLAFQLSRAAGRLDTRRDILVREANAIGTAYLRLDLLAPEEQIPLRDLFRRYADLRIRVQQAMPDVAAVEKAHADSIQLQGEIWARAVAGAQRAPSPAVATLVLSSLNEMIDITTTGDIAVRTHVPVLIIVLLCGVALLAALLAGFAMGEAEHRNFFHMLLFIGVTAITIYTILDLEFPRLGVIRIGAADQALIQARGAMN